MDPKQEEPTKEQLKEERQSQYMELYKIYQHQKENQKELYNIFKQNALNEDFTYSRRSALALIVFPSLQNLYYWWRPYSPMKNTFRVGVIIGCFVNFNYALKQDFKDLSKLDTPLANRTRKIAQEISLNNTSTRSFQAYTSEIYENRVKNEAESNKN